MHSKRSDGTDQPAELVAKAAAVRFDDGSRLTAIALTDHDSTAGLAGVETYYSRFNPDQVALLERLASEYGLITTGGSDYHGLAKSDLSIGRGMGGLEVSDEVLVRLEAARVA